jgi:hypothetical protein
MTHTYVTHCVSDAIVLVTVIVCVTYRLSVSPYDSHVTHCSCDVHCSSDVYCSCDSIVPLQYIVSPLSSMYP